MIIDRIDHFVLTVRDIEATCDFYQRALGMTPEVFGSGRTALKFGNQKINLHLFGSCYVFEHGLGPGTLSRNTFSAGHLIPAVEIMASKWVSRSILYNRKKTCIAIK